MCNRPYSPMDSKIFPFWSIIKKGLLIPGLNRETESPEKKATTKLCLSVYKKGTCVHIQYVERYF